MIETECQKQGEIIKIQLKDIQKLTSKLQKKYTFEDTQTLKSRIQEAQQSLRVLENIEPKSHHELTEKRKLLEAYGKEFGRIITTVHSIQENPQIPEVPEEKILAVAYEDEALIEKAKELKAIEGYILDINHMIKDCAETILEQGKELDTVENFVEISSAASKDAVGELEKANGYQKSNSSNCFCILGGIAAACLIIIVIYYI